MAKKTQPRTKSTDDSGVRVNMTFSFHPELKDALSEAAKACDRTVSGYVKYALKRAVIEDASRGGRTLPKSFFEKLGGAS